MGHLMYLGLVPSYAGNSHYINFLLENLPLLLYIKQKRVYCTVVVPETSTAYQLVRQFLTRCKLLGKGFLKYVPTVGQLYNQYMGLHVQ